MRLQALSMSDQKRVPPYPDKPKDREPLGDFTTYEYEFPFNYYNVDVERKRYRENEQHGLEMMPVPEAFDDDGNLVNKPADRIRIVEDQPIVRVTVIGSACTPPGYVQLEAEPLNGFRRTHENPDKLPVRFREDNLWGMHIRGDQNRSGLTYDQLPIAGMSSATFDIPKSEELSITGGSETPGWNDDTYPSDFHYSFRTIRVTVTE